jgi:hypothetical protein
LPDRDAQRRSGVDGILVQLPLPRISTNRKSSRRSPGRTSTGSTSSTRAVSVGQPGFVPCTPLGCLMLLKDRLGDLSGLDAVVIGRSNIVGKPMAQLLAESCTVTVAHSRTRNLPDVVKRRHRRGGRRPPELVKGDWIKPGATVIDVGINRVDAAEPGKTRLVGDVDLPGPRRLPGRSRRFRAASADDHCGLAAQCAGSRLCNAGSISPLEPSELNFSKEGEAEEPGGVHPGPASAARAVTLSRAALAIPGSRRCVVAFLPSCLVPCPA